MKKKNMKLSIIFLFLTTINQTRSFYENFKIINFESNPGIHFEKGPSVKILAENWKVLFRLNASVPLITHPKLNVFVYNLYRRTRDLPNLRRKVKALYKEISALRNNTKEIAHTLKLITTSYTPEYYATHTKESITILPDENLHIIDIFPKSRNSKIEELERTLNAETTQFWENIDNLKGRHARFTLLDLTLQEGLEAIQHVRKFTDELKFIVNNLISNQISSDLINNKDLLKIYNQIKEITTKITKFLFQQTYLAQQL